MKKKLLIIVGTRPEVLKMAPVIRSLREASLPFHFVHTGQHYEYDMSMKFVKELHLPIPKRLHLASSVDRPTAQTARIMIRTEDLIRKLKPTLVLIQGDTNTMLGAALASFKQNVSVGHVEAGLRSYDWSMQEEHNRRMVDHASRLLFAPTFISKGNLLRENVPGKIWVTGNTIIDTISVMMPVAIEKSNILDRISFDEYAVATIHRAENVENVDVLSNIVEAFIECPLPIVIPMHPRTESRLHLFGLYHRLARAGNIMILPPLGYLDFLILMKHCRVIITDSGGLQEEATAPQIKKRVIVVRESTERPEAVSAGFASVVGTRRKAILRGIESMTRGRKLPKSPYGDGKAANRILGVIREELQ